MSNDILDLAGRVALVTGSGQGVGRQIALHLAQHNSGGVAVNDYHLARAEAVVEEIRSAGGKAIAAQADVTDLAAVKAMNEKIKAELGPVGVLVNNAGNMGANPTADIRKPFWEVGPDVWNQAIGVNLYGVINCAAAVIPRRAHRHRKHGSLPRFRGEFLDQRSDLPCERRLHACALSAPHCLELPEKWTGYSVEHTIE